VPADQRRIACNVTIYVKSRLAHRRLWMRIRTGKLMFMVLRRVLLVAVLAAASFLAVPGSAAQARACPLGWSCNHMYYEDNTYTTVVGGETGDCDGTSARWGIRSVYQVYTEYPC
jgi:hypothetical protein